jgi:hypothetical protein
VISATETLLFPLHEFVMTLTFCDAAKRIGEIFELREGRAKDPLFDSIGVLESNYKNARSVLQRT